MQTAHKVLYCILGCGAILAALFSFMHPPGRTLEENHLGRELASAMIFIGLMFLWCMRHYEQRRPVHLALMAFALLLSLVHWFDVFRGTRPLMSGVINSVLFLVLLAMLPSKRESAAS